MKAKSSNHIESSAKAGKGRASLPSFSDMPLRINLRMMLGATLIAASFFSAYIISNSTSRMVSVWSAAVDLAPGTVLQAEDLLVTKVALPENAAMYINANATLIGSQVIRSVAASELIPAYGISEKNVSNLMRVPISASSNRLPHQIQTGAVVDVYALPKQNIDLTTNQLTSRAQLVVSQVGIDGINQEAGRLGGEVGLTLLVPTQYVNRLLSFVADSDFILVKSP